jgi:hypothetical protein
MKLNENQQFSQQTLLQTLYAFAKSVAVKVNRMAGAEFTATYNPPNLAGGAVTTTTIPAPGAQLGDYVAASFSLSTQGIILYPWVDSVGSVSVLLKNETGGALDLGSGTLKVRVSPE